MNRCKGFSLAELAVVMLIVSLLLAGALIPFSTQIDLKNIADTQRTMESIKEAIIGFAQANGRLPCPADGTLATGAANAGTEMLTPAPPAVNQCTTTAGVIPWAALGVPETDGWGRRFSYYVVQEFADHTGKLTWSTVGPPAQPPPVCTPAPVPGAPASFALCTLGNLTVNTRNESSHAATAIGSALPAVFISHGKNGFGAYTTTGGLIAGLTAGTDEAANASHLPATIVFYSRSPTSSASGCNDTAAGPFCEFDDLVTMITSNVLIARMVSAGRLP